MSLLRNVIDHFVMPYDDPWSGAHEDFVPSDEVPDRACAEPAPRTPPGVALLSAPADSHPVGAALALALAGCLSTRVAALCVWTAGLPAGPVCRAPALPAARRLTASLRDRGHDVVATGRLVVVRLPAAPADAAAQARRATAAAGAAPTVLALGGPRFAAFDSVLGDCDLVVVATASEADPALARLTLTGLASVTTRSCLCEVPQAHLARSLAAAGVTLLPSVRRALGAPVEALR